MQCNAHQHIRRTPSHRTRTQSALPLPLACPLHVRRLWPSNNTRRINTSECFVRCCSQFKRIRRNKTKSKPRERRNEREQQQQKLKQFVGSSLLYNEFLMHLFHSPFVLTHCGSFLIADAFSFTRNVSLACNSPFK